MRGGCCTFAVAKARVIHLSFSLSLSSPLRLHGTTTEVSLTPSLLLMIRHRPTDHPPPDDNTPSAAPASVVVPLQ